MNRFLARLERTILGRIAIEHLTTFIVGGMAIAFVLSSLRADFAYRLMLVPQLVASEPWRLVSFLFLPESSSIFFTLMALYFTWLMGTSLEQEWGALKFNLYYLFGALGTIAAALLTGVGQTNFYINLSLMLAFSTLFPDYEIRLYFLIPIRMKWLGLLSAAYLVLQFVSGGIGTRAAIGAVTANYLLFFGEHLWALARRRQTIVRQTSRRELLKNAGPAAHARSCAICGAKEEDGADIRVCSCEKCGGSPRELCLEHARNH